MQFDTYKLSIPLNISKARSNYIKIKYEGKISKKAQAQINKKIRKALINKEFEVISNVSSSDNEFEVISEEKSDNNSSDFEML